MTLDLADFVQSHLNQLSITDETFSEYILQIIDDDIEAEEQIAIISEFLVEASEANIQDEQAWVQQLLELRASKKLKEEKPVQIQPKKEIVVETRQTRTLKPELTREQRIERELFLKKYGYEVYETEEVNGEVEFVGGLRERKDEIINIRELNVSAVKEKETKRKQEMQQKHQKETMRNKEMQEKQRLEKELKKKGTQKREKVRA